MVPFEHDCWLEEPSFWPICLAFRATGRIVAHLELIRFALKVNIMKTDLVDLKPLSAFGQLLGLSKMFAVARGVESYQAISPFDPEKACSVVTWFQVVE